MPKKKRKSRTNAKSRPPRRSRSIERPDGFPTLQLPRPPVTEFTRVTAVPVFPTTGDAGPPEGSAGDYEIRFILGVPGVSSVATNLEMSEILASGDSLLEARGIAQIELIAADGSAGNTASMHANPEGRLASIRIRLHAENMGSAEREAHDQVMPVLSRLAFEADTPLEVKAVVGVELSTGTQMMGANLVGAVRPMPIFEGWSTEPLRPLLAAYREGLNSTSPLYQALSFYKVVEGVSTFHTRDQRAAKRSGGASPADPMDMVMPATLDEVPESAPWTKALFDSYLGKTFRSVSDAMSDVIRNASVHLTPGREVRVADYLADIEQCRLAVPVLRYMARGMIRSVLSSPSVAPPLP